MAQEKGLKLLELTFLFHSGKAKTFLRRKLFYVNGNFMSGNKKLLKRELWIDVIFPLTAHIRKGRLRDLNRADSFLEPVPEELNVASICRRNFFMQF